MPPRCQRPDFQKLYSSFSSSSAISAAKKGLQSVKRSEKSSFEGRNGNLSTAFDLDPIDLVDLGRRRRRILHNAQRRGRPLPGQAPRLLRDPKARSVRQHPPRGHVDLFLEGHGGGRQRGLVGNQDPKAVAPSPGGRDQGETPLRVALGPGPARDRGQRGVSAVGGGGNDEEQQGMKREGENACQKTSNKS